MMLDMTILKSPAGKISAIAAAILAASITACGSAPQDDESTTAASETSTREIIIEEAPLLVGMPLHMADERATVKAVDFGPEIVDGEEHERGIIDRSGWRIVAQCDEMKNGRVKVGVVKVEEHQAIVDGGQGSMIADNELQGLLECP